MNWIKPTGCSAGECVEVAFDPRSEAEHVGVRNSHMPADVIWFSRDEWATFIAAIKDGQFDQ